MGARTVQLDPNQRSMESGDLELGLRRKIVGQDEAVQAMVDLYQVFRAGLNSPGRPVGARMRPPAVAASTPRCHFWCHLVLQFAAFGCASVRGTDTRKPA